MQTLKLKNQSSALISVQLESWALRFPVQSPRGIEPNLLSKKWNTLCEFFRAAWWPNYYFLYYDVLLFLSFFHAPSNTHPLVYSCMQIYGWILYGIAQMFTIKYEPMRTLIVACAFYAQRFQKNWPNTFFCCNFSEILKKHKDSRSKNEQRKFEEIADLVNVQTHQNASESRRSS